jgi:hypothetical protein
MARMVDSSEHNKREVLVNRRKPAGGSIMANTARSVTFKKVTIKAQVQSTHGLTEAQVEGIRVALRGSRIRELGFGLPNAADVGRQAIILHDMIDMHIEASPDISA